MTGATSYRLDVATNGNFTILFLSNLNVGNVTSHNVTGLNAGTNYWYRVRAYNGGGQSANSNIIMVTTSPMSQVAAVDFTLGGGYPEPMQVGMTTATSGATIFYTHGLNPNNIPNPTHSGGTPGTGTFVYSPYVIVPPGQRWYFRALGYKAGMTDSVITDPPFEADNTQPHMPESVRSVTYNLDRAGNRSGSNGVVDNGVPTSYTLNNVLNEYNGVGTDTVTNGDQQGGEHEIVAYQNSYTYINDTHLVSVNNTYYQLAYDALGRCVSRTLTGVGTTYYFYDGEKPIQETGAVLASTVYGIGVDEPVIRFTPNYIYYFYQDHEGSVTHVLSGSTLVEQYRYDAFGAPTIKDGNGTVLTQSAIGNRFMFTGREWAPANLGFYDYRARAYHPGLGRFMSEDPKVFDAGDYNLFRYCHNDPEDLTDPMGLEGTDQTPTPRSQEQLSVIQQWRQAENLRHALGWSGGAIAMGQVNFAIGQLSQAVAQTVYAVKASLQYGDKMTGGPEYRAFLQSYNTWLENNRATLPPLAQNVLKAMDASGGIGIGVPVAGVTGTTYLYQKVGAVGEHLKFGITNNPATRYSAAQLNGGQLRIIGQGQRSEMLGLERQLHETLPLGPEERQSFYIDRQVESGLRSPPY